MKKLILTLLIGGFIMTGLSAKTAFVYFSATGTTERMAKNAANEMGADIFEIQPVHKYTDADLDWHDKKSLSSIECNHTAAAAVHYFIRNSRKIYIVCSLNMLFKEVNYFFLFIRAADCNIKDILYKENPTNL